MSNHHAVCPYCGRRIEVVVYCRFRRGRQYSSRRYGAHFESDGRVCAGSDRQIRERKRDT